MKKTTLLILMLFVSQIAFAQVTTVWEKSSAKNNFPKGYLGTGSTERGFATGKISLKPFQNLMERSGVAKNYPSYLGTNNTERGFAYSNVNNVEKIYLVGRKVATNVFIVNPATGDSLSKLDVNGITGGVLTLNDVEVSTDGAIFACNLTTNATTSSFKVYKWTNDVAVPKVVVDYKDLAIRLGDKFTVTGSTVDNSVTIWAVGAGTKQVVKFTTTDKGETFTPTVINFTGLAAGNSPAVFPDLTSNELFIKSNGQPVKRYSMTGTLKDSVPTTIVGTGANALTVFTNSGRKFLATYVYGTGNENIRVIEITDGLVNAKVVGSTQSLFSVGNANGVGDLAIKTNSDNTVTLWILATNNGIASYKITPTNYGTFDRMYIASRLVGTKVIVLNGANGDSLKTLDVTGITGGTFGLNDLEVAASGEIFGCNLTTSALTSAFKVYKWNDESSVPVVVVNYTGLALRFGDKFTVTGSSTDNSLTIWAVSATSNKVIKFTTADKGLTFTPTEITLSDGNAGNSPAIYPNNNNSKMYLKSNGQGVKEYNADGTFVETLPTAVISTGANALRYFEVGTKKFLTAYAYGAGNENLRIVEITNGLANGAFIGTTPSLGTVSNSNGVGDASFSNNNDGTVTLYVLGTNNGIGSYFFTAPKDVAIPTFSPSAGNYYDSVSVKISIGTAEAKIYYTTDGSEPTINSKLYTTPFTIKKTTTIKAIGILGSILSKVGSATYSIPEADKFVPLWAKTQSTKNFPRYFSTENYERGMTAGMFAGKARVAVAGRWLGPKVILFDALKGDSVATILPDANVTGGTFPLNYPGLSDDGVLFVSNMTIDASTSPFKIYRWDNEKAASKTAIEIMDANLKGARLGDAISVFGKVSDNSLAIYAAVSAQNKVLKITTADGGKTFKYQEIVLKDKTIGSVPNVSLINQTTFFIKSYGKPTYMFHQNGALLDSVISPAIGNDVTNIKYFEQANKQYLLCYHPNDSDVLTDERLTLVDITKNTVAAERKYYSNSIGDKPNLNATGSVAYYKINDRDFIYYVLGTNNGLAAFTTRQGVVSVQNEIANIPTEYQLEQNYPNPFNPVTTIRFSLKVDATVSLKVYNLIGEEVASLVNGEIKAGMHNLRFNPSNLASGVYFYRMEAKGIDGSSFSSVKKLMFLK